MYIDILVLTIIFSTFIKKRIERRKRNILVFIFLVTLIPVRSKIKNHIQSQDDSIGFTHFEESDRKHNSRSTYMNNFEVGLISTMIHEFPLFYFAWGPYYYYTGYLRYKFDPNFKHSKFLEREKKRCRDKNRCVHLYKLYAKLEMKKEYKDGFKEAFRKGYKNCGFVSNFHRDTMKVYNNNRKEVLKEIGEILEETAFKNNCEYSLNILISLNIKERNKDELVRLSIKGCKKFDQKTCFNEVLFFLSNIKNYNRSQFHEISKAVCNEIDQTDREVKLFCSNSRENNKL